MSKALGPTASLSSTFAIPALMVPPSAAVRKSSDALAGSPLTSDRSPTMTVPSGRRSSTRRISARRTRLAKSASSSVRRAALGPAGSRSPCWT